MFRRNFIQRFTLAGASGLVAPGAVNAAMHRTVSFRVSGFSCVTCAIGLDTVLRQQQGVVRCQSSYPDALTTVEFNPALVTKDALKAAIAELGFTAQEKEK